MKTLLNVIISLLLVIFISVAIVIYLVKPTDIETFEINNEFSFEEKFNELELDLFDLNEVALTEHEINQLVLPIIYEEIDTLEKTELPSYKYINNAYISCTDRGFIIKSSINIWNFKVGLNINGVIIPEEGRIKIIISNVDIGKIKVSPEMAAKITNIYVKDFEIVLDDGIFETINIDSILINDNGLQAYFYTNNQKAIEMLVDPSVKEFASEVLSIIEEDDGSKRFGNKLVKILIKKHLGFKISQEELFDLMDSFSTIHNKQKLDIIFALGKLNIDINNIVNTQ